jgi:hypothetical protein
MAATKSAHGMSVADALETLERCCKPPTEDVTSCAVEAAAECKAKAERMQKKAEELEKGAEANQALAAKLTDARDKYKAVYRLVENARDDIARDLADLEPKLCHRVGRDMACELEEELAEKIKCRDEACAAVGVLTGKPRHCFEPESCDCDDLSKAEIEGAKAAAEAKVAELTGYLETLLTRDVEVKALLDEIVASIAALKVAISTVGAERKEFVQFLLIKAHFWDKLGEGRLNTPARYEARLAELFKQIRNYNCHILPELSDCLTGRTQDVDRAQKCCDDHTTNLIDEVVGEVETEYPRNDCHEEPPCPPPVVVEEEPCEDEPEGKPEDQPEEPGENDDPTGW